ncbi:hypothetical protein [Jeotgalibacillus aurantiacus]|uniref:hypothetical protein n=1 Tax=Jeotgalibacillus aurantiacus TaxID=2763266 RepID=UPI001D0B5AF8|nr:hypothetical protein [Jeotgalibacillus aurantiacus]
MWIFVGTIAFIFALGFYSDRKRKKRSQHAYSSDDSRPYHAEGTHTSSSVENSTHS